MNPAYIRGELAASVTPAQQVALVRVMEECAELAKEAGKALRFGPGNRYPAEGPTNLEKMRTEFGDIRAALTDAGVLSASDVARIRAGIVAVFESESRVKRVSSARTGWDQAARAVLSYLDAEGAK